MSAQSAIPQNAYVTAIGILLIGMIAGLEGSGFSGLPLTGSLAGTLGPATGVEPETPAAIGQMGNIWSGGGTLVAWSSLIAVAGFARVSVIELARMCFLPVVIGLLVVHDRRGGDVRIKRQPEREAPGAERRATACGSRRPPFAISDSSASPAVPRAPDATITVPPICSSLPRRPPPDPASTRTAVRRARVALVSITSVPSDRADGIPSPS